MSEKIHVLAQQLLGKSSIAECELQEVKNLANRYPYFAPAQFLLLEKLRKESSPEYAAQLQKAVLYYHDPLEFEYFSSPDRFETEIDFEENYQLSVSSEQPGESSFEPTVLPEKEISGHTINELEISQTETVETITEDGVQIPVEEKMEASIEHVLQQEEKQIHQPPSNSDFVFEPYHTVDYFASQGIKLSLEDNTSKDKFTKQLKSFTEWLKSMKRLPATELSREIDPSTEFKVQHLAEDSVHQSEIVTEAMAEVWIKQGNKEKAIETFHKLSLLNPSKKAYFAALIDNLKRS